MQSCASLQCLKNWTVVGRIHLQNFYMCVHILCIHIHVTVEKGKYNY